MGRRAPSLLRRLLRFHAERALTVGGLEFHAGKRLGSDHRLDRLRIGG